ncbi:MAG: hypothetical protein GY727_13700, partial [Gammaproteobacteria bacterium]|nr:hypothetical protein [Gammaproteobacteria bacterium]
ALQAEWIATEANHKAVLSTAIKYEGTQAMELDVEGADIVGDEWARTFATTDFSGYTGQFWMYANKEYKDVKMRVFVEDSSANKSSTEIVTVDKNAWYLYVIPVDLLTADGGTAADLTDIVKIGFRVEKEKRDGLVYIDKMVSVPQPGSVILKLWDMGSTMPADGVTSIDDGTQYEKLGDVGITGLQQASVSVDLVGGKRTYHIDKFVAGTALEIPTNELLNIGNYYAITIHYDDTEVNVYGANTSFNNDYYVNGYAFTAPDESTAITKLGQYNDIMFCIHSTQDAWLVAFGLRADAVPNGGSEITCYTEDNNMMRVNPLLTGVQPAEENKIDVSGRPAFLVKGGKFEAE